MASQIIKILFTLLPILSVPFILMAINRYLKIPTWLVLIVSLILVWGTIVLMAEFHHHQAVVNLERFDLDGNGVFNGDEITPEQQQAMKTVTNDTGRALAPFTGAIVSLMYHGVLFGIWALIKQIKQKLNSPNPRKTL